jgi:hypothetical protein
MIDAALNDRANEIVGRLFALNEEVANGRAFRALLEDLHARDDLSAVKEPHIAAIAAVRAGILRALISSVVACLDRSDRRGNRASVGQILSLLEDAEVVALFKTETAALQRAKDEYVNLVKSELFERGRSLRNKAIAHLLTTNAPTATYETFYDLHDAAERLTIGLFEACGRGEPTFFGHRATLTAHAKIFWDTYFVGMRCR